MHSFSSSAAVSIATWHVSGDSGPDMASVGCRNSVFQCGALSAGPEVDLFHFNVNAMALREIMFKCFLNVN